VERLSTPTLMIQGGSDYCDDPKESESLERFFTERYDRLLLEGIGHFPHRESPIQIVEAVIRLIRDVVTPTCHDIGMEKALDFVMFSRFKCRMFDKAKPSKSRHAGI